MWTHGFHNSVNGDRTYNANQMSNIFEGLITAGVYEAVGNKLAVQPNSGMTIQIATGRGWFNERWVNNDAPYLINLEASDVVLNRYAAICVRGDNSSSVRTTQPYVKYSDFATTPVKPTMTRTDDIKEYCLAYVYIAAGATSITAANIEDTRQDKNLCGWVTGLINQITPDTLYSQFTAQFNSWFNGLVDIIDENVETTLVNALPKALTVNLPVAGWKTVNNLLNSTLQNTTRNGITCTRNSDGTYTLNGTASDRADFTFISKSSLLPQGRYKLTGCPSGGHQDTYTIQIYNSNTSEALYEVGNGIEFDYNGTDNMVILIIVRKGKSVDNLVFKPMITTELSVSYGEYTPYGNAKSVQTASVTGMNNTKSVLVTPNAETLDAYSSNGLKATAQGTNSITFTANTKPTAAIKVDILHMGQ